MGVMTIMVHRAIGCTLQTSIHFEKAAILFNIAAIASQLAVATDRTTDAGVKEAARLFQASVPRTSRLVSTEPFCCCDHCIRRKHRSFSKHRGSEQLQAPLRAHQRLLAHAQEAAGAFAFLRDEASLKMDTPRPHDVGPEAAAMLERLMLAQVINRPYIVVVHEHTG